MRNYIIFSDLDGTLLDHKTYTFDPALEALSIIKSRQIPLILSSSKTRAEIERIQSHLALKDPFIFEMDQVFFITIKLLALVLT